MPAVDFSALWAGPLCGAILALAGHYVVKVEAVTRPDPARQIAPVFDERLNGHKQRMVLPGFTTQHVQSLIEGADIIVTSARPRAFDAIGLAPAQVFAINPGLIWVAITAFGWWAGNGLRVGFGDEAAVAGGLVNWRDDVPHFAGDAVADPLTGLAAAVAALAAIEERNGVLIDAAMASVAACFASQP